MRRAGEPVRIQPKPFELLRLLLRARDRVLGFDALMAALWPDEIVSPASLNRAVTHARRAIGDTGRGALIASVPRRGYRFLGEVVELGGAIDATEREDGAAPRAGSPPPRADDGRRTRASERARRFVGRRDALARLELRRSAMLEGELQLVLVGGRAGIGKTRLAEIFARQVAREGVFVATARARDGSGYPAFWPWIQVLRQLLEEPALRDEIARRIGTGEIAALLPALVEFAPEVAASLGGRDRAMPDLSDDQQRFRFFDAAARALRACASRRPILLLLEDLQWADSGSLRLLEHLALELARTPVLLLLTLRDAPRERGHPVRRTLALLRQQPAFEAIDLAGLSRGEVGELLRAAAGRPAPVDLVSELYARTEGVPLFVGEAIRLLEERGDLAHLSRVPRQGVTLPAHAVDLIRRAIDALPPECVELLGAAAVLGRDFTLRDVAAVASADRARALDWLDAAMGAGLLEASSEGPSRFRFAHALYREALYEDLAAGRRARLHLAAARHIERQQAGILEPVLSELADHLHRALAVGDAEHAHAIALQASRQAQRLLAWEQAAIHLEQALDALDHLEEVEPRRRAELLLALGESQRLSGHRERRIAAYEQVVAIARAIDDAALLAHAALGLCDVSEWSAHTPPTASDAIAGALASLDPQAETLRARLTCRLGYLDIRRRERAEPLAREALALARTSGSPVALEESLYILHYAISGPDDLDERAALIDDLEDAARNGADRDVGVIALLDIACDGLMQGRLEKAIELRARAAALAGEVPTPSMTWHLRVWDTGLALMQGRFDEAEQRAHDALLLGRRVGHPFAGTCFSGQMSILERERGREAETAQRMADKPEAPAGASHWASAVLGRAFHAIGDERRARAQLAALAANGFQDLVRNIRWNASIVEIAMLVVEIGDDAVTPVLLRALETQRAQHGVIPIPIAYGGPFVRPIAGLTARLGRADEALALYDEALEAAAALAAEPTVARIELEAAPLRARAGKLARAVEGLRTSASIAESLGMARVLEAARGLRGRLQG
ncbi:MAG: AAA family ATPase [Myxococcota bacterium]